MNWSLVIVTFNRPDALRRCIELATSQSRAPAEVVVVDASDNWEAHRDVVLGDVAARAPTSIRWCYQRALVRGTPSQRNQAIPLATSDVLFLIDDDAFMHPGCAEEIMKVYEADVRGYVAGVAATETDKPPEIDDHVAWSVGAKTVESAVRTLPRTLVQRFLTFIERELFVERLLLPYDEKYPDYVIPSELTGAAVVPTRFLGGFRMTFRASVIRQVGFDETLSGYASAEDLDASYRASRFGMLLNALNARIFHAQDSSERLSRHTRTLLLLLNLAYLYRRNGHNPVRLLGAYRWRVLRRLAIDVVRDLGRKRLSLPCARADMEVLSRLGRIECISDGEIVGWYAMLQKKIIARNHR